MRAVPYRSELRARALGTGAATLAGFAVAVAVIAAAGRIDDLDARWYDAIAIVVAVLIATAIYAGSRRQLRQRLGAPLQLAPDAERIAPPAIRWRRALLRGIVGGVALGGIALLLEFDIDALAVVLALALGGLLGRDVVAMAVLARHEREHGRTVYRLEDTSGEDGGLALG